MINNDILVRLRYALDLSNNEMLKLFKLGGFELSQDELRLILVKSKDWQDNEGGYVVCSNKLLHVFFDGLIRQNRGVKENAKDENQEDLIQEENMNNVLLKKTKIALSLTSEDVIAIFKQAGVLISKGEVSAMLRKKGHKNYRDCGDRYARGFLKGLALTHRK